MIRRPRRSVRNRAALDPSNKITATPIKLKLSIDNAKLICQASVPVQVKGIPPIVIDSELPIACTPIDEQTFELTYNDSISSGALVTLPSRMPQVRNRFGGYPDSYELMISDVV